MITHKNYVKIKKTTNWIARKNLRKEKQKIKKYHDKKVKEIEFKVGDKILLHDETMRRRRSKKLDSLITQVEILY